MMREVSSLELVAGGNIIRQGEYFRLGYLPRDVEGQPVNLDGKDITVAILKRSQIVHETVAEFDPGDGLIHLYVDQNIGNGKMWLEFTVTDPNFPSYRKKFPSRQERAILDIVPGAEDLEYVGVGGMTVEKLQAEQASRQQAFEAEIVPQVEEFKQRVEDGIGAFTEDTEVLDARMGEVNLREFNRKTTEKLAETVKLSDTGVLDLNVFDEPTRTAIQGLAPGEVNAVLGYRNVKSINLAPESIDTSKLDFGVFQIPKSKNLFDRTRVTSGFYVNYSTGELVVNSGYSASNFISVDVGAPYMMKVLEQGAWYTMDKVFISGFNTNSTLPLVAPSNAAFVRFSTPNNSLEKQQFEKGINSTDYELPNSLKKLPVSRIEMNELITIKKVISDTLFNKAVKTKFKLIGDSITAGEGGTGFSPDGAIIPGSEAVFTGGRKISTQGYSWANMLRDLVTNKFNRTYFVPATDPMVKYDLPYSYNGAFDSSLIFINKTKNRAAQLNFYGDTLTLRYTAGTNAGIVDVYLDGALYTSLDTYSTTPGNKDLVFTGLSVTSHKIEIYETNTKNASSSNFNFYLAGFGFKKYASVVNYGVSGYRSDTAMLNATNLIESDDDIVLMQLGTNDRHNNTNIEEVKRNLRKIIRVGISKNPNIKFILMSANPTNPTEANQPAKHYSMFEVDKAIKELALEMKMEYISNYDAFLQYCEYTSKPLAELIPDTLHPGDLGYDVMFRNIVRSLGIPFVAPGVTK